MSGNVCNAVIIQLFPCSYFYGPWIYTAVMYCGHFVQPFLLFLQKNMDIFFNRLICLWLGLFVGPYLLTANDAAVSDSMYQRGMNKLIEWERHRMECD